MGEGGVPASPRHIKAAPPPPGVNLQKKEATNYGTDWTVPRGAAGVCALCWGEPAQSEVRPWGGEGRGGGECVPVPSPRNPPLVPPQLLVGCRDRSVKLFSTEKGKFRESRVCPGGDGPFCGLAAYGRYRRGGGRCRKPGGRNSPRVGFGVVGRRRSLLQRRTHGG